MAEPPVIRVEGIRNQFGAQVVHDGLDLEVRKAEILAIVGGSGTGKSVLLRTIVGLIRPAAGRIEVFGTDMGQAGAKERQRVETRWGLCSRTAHCSARSPSRRTSRCRCASISIFRSR